MSDDAHLIVRMVLWFALQAGLNWWTVRRAIRFGTGPPLSPSRRKLALAFVPIVTLVIYALDGALSPGHSVAVYVVAGAGVLLSPLPTLWNLRRTTAIRDAASLSG